MAHGILIPAAIAATNIDSFNRSAASASAIDNGWVFQITSKMNSTASSGSGAELWNIDKPVTGSLTSLWMAYQGDEVVTTNSQYKGLDPDPRNFFTPAGYVLSLFRPHAGDLIELNADAISGSASTGNYVVAVNASASLVWSATSPMSGSLAPSAMTFVLRQTKFVPFGTGAIDTQRIVMYQLECLYNND